MPASCQQIAVADDAPSCEVALLAMQAYHLKVYVNEYSICGNEEGEMPINPADNPTCEALNTCCPTIRDSLDSTVCAFIQGLHFQSSCEYAISYFKGKGDCSDVAIDAGAWPGLAPVETIDIDAGETTATSVTSDTSAATTESHSSM